MSKSLIRFFYDYGGVCFWNEQGAAVTPEQLGLSPETTRKAYELTEQFDASMNWDWDIRLWNQEECDRFNQATRELVEAARMEVGERFEVVNEQGEFAEDARLDECLQDQVRAFFERVQQSLNEQKG